MAVEPDRNDDLLRLNALVDGELPAAVQAELAARLATDRNLARAHATLASLKASVVASAADEAVPPLPAIAKHPRLPFHRFALAAAVVLAAISIFFAAGQLGPHSNDESELPRTIVKLAGLPSSPIVPDLGIAGLKLTGISMERQGSVPIVVASYQGPRGCRLELRVHQAGMAIPPAAGTSRWVWTVDELAYELISSGMPSTRFAAVAAAAEYATRNGGSEDNRRLREASLHSRPCVG